MRELVPVPGDEFVGPIHVVIQKGASRTRHPHPEWTALYYEEPGDPPAALLVHIDGEVERIVPERGMVVVLEPNVIHSVEQSQSETPRVSWAILVTPTAPVPVQT